MKIAIAGYGIEGESSYRYYSKDPNNQVYIVDECNDIQLPAGTKSIVGPDALEQLGGFDLVIRTPSLSPSKIKTNGIIWSATNEFFSKCPAKIIGVTGSKGKGTVSSLISEILKKDDKKVWLVGNIGAPSLDVLDKIKSDDIVVYELSSFQLWDIKKSPHIAVILFIEKEHQDVHSSMDEYVNAKANIVKFQSANDFTIYNVNNQYSKEIAKGSKAKLITYPNNVSAHFDDKNLYYNEQIICSIDKIKLIGEHNKDNICAAINVVWPLLKSISSIGTVLSNFTGLPHRLQFIRELNGVRYYDDSIATTPSSAIAALNSFNNNTVIILGGSSKGSDFDELAKTLKQKSAKVLLIGQEAEKIAKSCNTIKFSDYEIVNFKDMQSLVHRAKQLSKPGGVVLLSPASASFGLFKNYIDRGEQFKNAVMALKS